MSDECGENIEGAILQLTEQVIKLNKKLDEHENSGCSKEKLRRIHAGMVHASKELEEMEKDARFTLQRIERMESRINRMKESLDSLEGGEDEA